MASLSAQMMCFGQALTGRMRQLHSTVTGLQQDKGMFTNTLHAIKDLNKITLLTTINFWMTWRKY